MYHDRYHMYVLTTTVKQRQDNNLPRTNFQADFVGNTDKSSANAEQFSRRDLSKATIFIVFTQLVFEKIGLEIHPRVCVMLLGFVVNKRYWFLAVGLGTPPPPPKAPC